MFKDGFGDQSPVLQKWSVGGEGLRDYQGKASWKCYFVQKNLFFFFKSRQHKQTAWSKHSTYQVNKVIQV